MGYLIILPNKYGPDYVNNFVVKYDPI